MPLKSESHSIVTLLPGGALDLRTAWASDTNGALLAAALELHVELDVLSVGQRAKALRFDGRVMHEVVIPFS